MAIFQSFGTVPEPIDIWYILDMADTSSCFRSSRRRDSMESGPAALGDLSLFKRFTPKMMPGISGRGLTDVDRVVDFRFVDSFIVQQTVLVSQECYSRWLLTSALYELFGVVFTVCNAFVCHVTVCSFLDFTLGFHFHAVAPRSVIRVSYSIPLYQWIWTCGIGLSAWLVSFIDWSFKIWEKYFSQNFTMLSMKFFTYRLLLRGFCWGMTYHSSQQLDDFLQCRLCLT